VRARPRTLARPRAAAVRSDRTAARGGRTLQCRAPSSHAARTAHGALRIRGPRGAVLPRAPCRGARGGLCSEPGALSGGGGP
jgi:hypothetical protein